MESAMDCSTDIETVEQRWGKEWPETRNKERSTAVWPKDERIAAIICEKSLMATLRATAVESFLIIALAFAW